MRCYSVMESGILDQLRILTISTQEVGVIVMTFWYVYWNGLTFFKLLNYIFTWD